MAYRKVRWGLIGCGDISRKRVAPALRDLPSCDLVAVNRANFALAEEFAKEFGARRWYPDWHDLLNDPEIEAVYIATPVYLHREQTIAAAERGKHVLCEKPMALKAADCDEMISACQANHVKLGVAYYRHFYPVLARVNELLSRGAIGDLSLAQVNAFEFFNPKVGEPRHWFVQKDLAGGGPMMDFGCHRIEVLLYLCGAIEKTLGLTTKVMFEREVEDTAVAIFQFENKAIGMLTVTHTAFENQDTLDLFGSKGSLRIPNLNQGKLIIRTPNGDSIEILPPDNNLHAPLIDDFTSAVLSDQQPKVDGAIGKMVALIEEQIYNRSW